MSTNDCPDATFQIAIWSNIEAALGITAGSLATLRPLLRHWLGSRSDSDYSGFPRRSTSRRLGNTGQRAVPLGSIDVANHGELRPDKLAVVVTNIESQRRRGSDWTISSGVGSSEEGLTEGNSTPPMPGRMEVGIHRTFEVTQTARDGDSVGSRRDILEHV